MQLPNALRMQMSNDISAMFNESCWGASSGTGGGTTLAVWQSVHSISSAILAYNSF
jgi:hypothetical protein